MHSTHMPRESKSFRQYVCILAGLVLAFQAVASGSDSPDPVVPVLNAEGAYVLTYKLLGKTKIPNSKTVVFDPELKKLVGKKITISGFVQPFEDAQDMWTFMIIQYPVGCWYCEAPGPLGILLVEMPEGKELENKLSTGYVKVTGLLELNEEDPTDFLYIVTQATAVRAEQPVIPQAPPTPPKRKPHPSNAPPHKSANAG